MKRLLILVMVLGMVGMMADRVMAQASTDTGYINLLISPIVRVELDVSPTFYDFQSVELEQSTCSVSALQLLNNGNVGFTVSKAVWDDGVNWDITVSSTATDGFELWAVARDSQPGQGDFSIGKGYEFSNAGTGNATYTDLNNVSAVQLNLNPTLTENLWFRLDLPKYVTTEAKQTISVRLRATSN